MTTKHSILIALIGFVAFITISTQTFAQVKVGSNPTSIGTTSNLEVEASNGNKTIINKATGQVTVIDGTQGVGKVFTSDANGAASWVAPVAPPATTIAPFSAVLSTTRQSFTASVAGNTAQEVKFDGESFDASNAFTPTTGRFTAPTAGYYLFSGAVQFDNTLVSGQPTFAGVSMTLTKNFGATGSSRLGQYVATGGGTIVSGSLSTIAFLNAGDYVSLTAGAQISSGTTYQLVSLSFYGYKIAN
ncbi:C1q-like domain-containing protein [Flectobacillus sp. BAB-3569]|uniref:C1q-like domain-containing protein n=1 Tax=Flectobacillus sp. BAB-3569 TaxID=1509483 RepID=UPI000BA43CD1|nr:hypothetical protein [Flectobacillus sp. BAB-3569]PAC27664.1 hypothetical protein BWI92_21890 [Flectobacillus sp. BAB-3569]